MRDGVDRDANEPSPSSERGAFGGGGGTDFDADPEVFASTASSAPTKGRLCIVSRKNLRDITRVPRMAKALVDAGYAVTVVSYRAPVPELRDLCLETEYVEITPRPFTGAVLAAINGGLARRQRRRQRRDKTYRRALERGGLRAAIARARHAVLSPLPRGAERAARIVVGALFAVPLRKSGQTSSAARRELSRQPVLQTVSMLVRSLHTWATSHAFGKEAERALRGRRFDVVQAHDNYALVAAARLASRGKAKLLYDAVELASHRLALDLNLCERASEWFERREEAAILRRAAAVTTVGDGLADWYSRNFSIARPLVVRNCRYYWPYQIDTRLRADIGGGPEARILVWFGGAYPEQGIELLIRAVPLLPVWVHVAIVATFLPRWARFVESLPGIAAGLGVGDRVHVLPPRTPSDLIPYVSGADIGVIPRPSQYLNNFYSMPNKFLEMVMARLPIAVSRLGDIVDAVRKYDIGEVFDERDPGAVARVVGNMLEPETYARLRANVMRAAEEMTWESESVAYLALVNSLVSRAVPREQTRNGVTVGVGTAV